MNFVCRLLFAITLLSFNASGLYSEEIAAAADAGRSDRTGNVTRIDRGENLERLAEEKQHAAEGGQVLEVMDEFRAKRVSKDLNDDDYQMLRQLLEEKRKEAKERKTRVLLTGDVRMEWRHLHEKGLVEEEIDGEDVEVYQELRGSGKYGSRNDFDIELRLRLDYKGERTWGVAMLKYDNSAGVDSGDRLCSSDPHGIFGSGRCNDICLRKAYFGYHVFNDKCYGDLDLMIGRYGNLYDAFESDLEFLSRLDGVILNYSTPFDYADWYVKWAGFIVNEKIDQYAWGAEVGFLNIYDQGIDLKYSFIDWEKYGRGACPDVRHPLGFQFQVSQIYGGYHFNPEFCGKTIPVEFYSAFLWNSAAENIYINDENLGKQNLGWYIGAIIGKVRKKGDWSCEIEYQVLEAQGVSEGDVSGIGRGNVLKDSFTYNRRGNTNYKGWFFELLYGITNDLTLDTIVEWSNAYNTKIGGKHHYSKFEMETIYTF